MIAKFKFDLTVGKVSFTSTILHFIFTVSKILVCHIIVIMLINSTGDKKCPIT